MTTPNTAQQVRIDRDLVELRRLKRDNKALLAINEENVQQLAVVAGAHAVVLVPYSAAGFPNGNYHRDEANWKRCRRLTLHTKIRRVTEHDASKLLERCSFCTWH